MADWFGAAKSLIGGATGFFSSGAEAKGYKAAEASYRQAADITHRATGIKQMQLARDIYKTEGSAIAAAGASGIQTSGSVLDILASSAQQGALDRALISEQGRVQESSYLGQAAQAAAAAQAKKSGGVGSLIGGALSAVGSIFGFSDRVLKTNLVKVGEHLGIPVYQFKYAGSDTVWEGVLAQDVQAVMPDAVVQLDDGLAVDYGMLGLALKKVSDAAD